MSFNILALILFLFAFAIGVYDCVIMFEQRSFAHHNVHYRDSTFDELKPRMAVVTVWNCFYLLLRLFPISAWWFSNNQPNNWQYSKLVNLPGIELVTSDWQSYIQPIHHHPDLKFSLRNYFILYFFFRHFWEQIAFFTYCRLFTPVVGICKEYYWY